MAIKYEQNKKEAPARERKYLPDDISVTVFGVREMEDGRIVFNLSIMDSITIYGCRIGSNKKGEAFIAYPAQKGKDGHWYNHAFAAFTETASDRIIGEVFAKVKGD